MATKTKRKSRLEIVMERRAKRERRNEMREREREARTERRKDRNERATFLRRIKVLFARLMKMVDVTIDKHSESLSFEYKGTDYYICRDYWKHEYSGVDDYTTEGYQWVLKKDNPYAGDKTSTVLSDDDVKKDMTRKVMSGLKELDRDSVW